MPVTASPLPLTKADGAPRRRLAVLLDRDGTIFSQFLRFGVVGTVGFLIDYSFVHTAHFVFGMGLVLAGILSFFVAASGNWLLNRVWTFRGMSSGRLHHEWMRYLGTNALGFVLNRGVYITLVTTTVICVHYPVLALAAGAIAGLGVNFAMARRVVFR